MLQRLPDDGACALISDAAVEKALGVDTAGKRGMKHGRVQRILSYDCDYDRAIPSLRISVSTTYPEQSDEEILDRHFEDDTKEWRPVGEYEEVPGLGTSARLGPIPEYETSSEQWQLVALCDVEGERLLVTLTANFVETGDPLRALAQEAMSTLGG